MYESVSKDCEVILRETHRQYLRRNGLENVARGNRFEGLLKVVRSYDVHLCGNDFLEELARPTSGIYDSLCQTVSDMHSLKPISAIGALIETSRIRTPRFSFENLEPRVLF